MSELKPCPFCGKMPEVEPNGDCYCDNYICPMAPDSYMPGDWNTRPIEDDLRKRIAEFEEKQRWRVVADGELPEVYRDEDGEFIPFLVCEGDGDRPFIAMYGGINWHAGIFVPDITHWMPLPELPEVQE